MVDDKRHGGRVRWSARIAFVTGVAASVAANIAAAEPTAGARIVAAWPAVALLLVVEMLARARRAPAPPPLGAPQTTADVSQNAPVPHRDEAEQSSPSTPARRRSAADTALAIASMQVERPNATRRDIAEALGLSERHVRRLMADPLADSRPA